MFAIKGRGREIIVKRVDFKAFKAVVLQEQRIKALIAMPSAQNPLGCGMSLENKKRLAKLVNTYHV
ncbi:hypothetical protein HZD82_25010, partial [Pantoea agglomerans]|uniref:hypothetical protein n=1 Tax=Enterobacter agglomerans TaxID=549 RepID=UPI001A8E83F4